MDNITFPQLVGPTYSMASLNADCQRCMNLQLEAIESGEGANEYYLRETPGLLLAFDLGEINPLFIGKSIQGMAASTLTPDVFYIVIEDYFLVISTFLGALSSTYMNSPATVNPSRLKMVITENTTGVFVVPMDPTLVSGNTIGMFSLSFQGDPTTYFRYDGGVTSPVGYNGLNTIGFINNRLVVIDVTNTKFQISPIAVATNGAWSAAEVYSVEGAIDTLVVIAINGSEVWCFGNASYEVFTDVGGANLHVFSRIRDAVVRIGCISRDSVQQMNGHVFWLGTSAEGLGVIYMSNGLNAQRISTAAIEEIIYTIIRKDPNDPRSFQEFLCDSWTYSLPGHTVYVLTLKYSANYSTSLPDITIAYDTAIGQWHELSYRDPITGETDRHRGKFACRVGSMQYVADHTLPYVYELSPTTYTDNLAPIIRYRRSPVLLDNNRRIFFKRLILNMQVGVGLTPTATPSTTDDPEISVRWSNDNANTFGNYHTASLGAIGRFLHQVIFNRQGSSLRRVYEVYFDAAVPFRLITAELGVSVGAH